MICLLTLGILHRLDQQRWQHSILPHATEAVRDDEHAAASYGGAQKPCMQLTVSVWSFATLTDVSRGFLTYFPENADIVPQMIASFLVLS